MSSKNHNRPSITGWQDLNQYGINILTGEACGYSLRLLCDVNDKGKQLLNEFFSGQMTFSRNWNSKVGDDPATGSIMLPGEIMKPLVFFIMYHVEKVAFVACGLRSFDFHGYMQEDEEADPEILRKAGYDIRFNFSQLSSQPTENGRAVHAMTGRSH